VLVTIAYQLQQFEEREGRQETVRAFPGFVVTPLRVNAFSEFDVVGIVDRVDLGSLINQVGATGPPLAEKVRRILEERIGRLQQL
jgi:hypothetical protein